MRIMSQMVTRADENLQGDDGDLGGEGVCAEDEEDGGDEDGIAGRDQGGGAGGDAEGRAEAVAVEERTGQQAHLVGVGEEPVVGTGEGDIDQDHEAAKQRHDKDDGEGTAARARVCRGRCVREMQRGLICHGMEVPGLTERWYQTGTLPGPGMRAWESRWRLMRRIDKPGPGGLAGQVVLLGTRWATARSPAIMVKISGMPVVGREAEMQAPPPWDAV